MRLYYCEKCETRLSEEELESGKALRDAEGNIYCAACAPDSLNNPVRSSARKVAARPPSVARNQPADHTSAAHDGTRNSSASLPQKRFSVEWMVLGGGVLVLALVLGLYAFGGFGSAPKKNPVTETVAAIQTVPTTKPASTPAATTPLVTDTKQVAQPAANTKPAEFPSPDSRSVFDDVIREHAREMDPELRKAIAARRLNEAAEFYKKNPQDPWTYVDMLRLVPKGAPAGDDATRIIAELKLPADKSDTPAWYRDWNFGELGANATPRYELDGRKNLLQTLAPGRDSELLFNRKISVPAERPHLLLAARTEDKSICKIVVEIDGKQQVYEELNGKSWRTFDLDLSALKGKEMNIQIRHVNTPFSSPKVFWTAPVFFDAPQHHAKIFAFNPQAPLYTKPPPPAKHVFVAPASWKEAPAWKTSVDILALADPKAGAVSGTWVRGEKGELQCNKADLARIGIAYRLPEQYDIRATFERKAGLNDATLILMHGRQPFAWAMGADNNKYFAIWQVDGKKVDFNPTAVRTGTGLKNSQKYTTVVEVRKDRISAYLDGTLITEWVPAMGELSIDSSRKLPEGKQLGLASWQSEVVFYSMELVEVK